MLGLLREWHMEPTLFKPLTSRYFLLSKLFRYAIVLEQEEVSKAFRQKVVNAPYQLGSMVLYTRQLITIYSSMNHIKEYLKISETICSKTEPVVGLLNMVIIPSKRAKLPNNSSEKKKVLESQAKNGRLVKNLMDNYVKCQQELFLLNPRLTPQYVRLQLKGNNAEEPASIR